MDPINEYATIAATITIIQVQKENTLQSKQKELKSVTKLAESQEKIWAREDSARLTVRDAERAKWIMKQKALQFEINRGTELIKILEQALVLADEVI